MKSTVPLLTIAILLLSASWKNEPREVPVIHFDKLESLLQEPGDTTYIINFWATWCKPCVMEMPYFEQIEKDYVEDDSVKVLLVSLDFPENLQDRVVPFMERRDIVSEVWLLDEVDANSWIDKVDTTWSGALPATVIINRDYRYFHEGMMNYNELDSIITNHKL